MKLFLIAGGDGFIGSQVIRFLIEETDHRALNLDNRLHKSWHRQND